MCVNPTHTRAALYIRTQTYGRKIKGTIARVEAYFDLFRTHILYVFLEVLAVAASFGGRERKCDSQRIVHRRNCTDGAHSTTRPRAYLAITLYLLKPNAADRARLILAALRVTSARLGQTRTQIDVDYVIFSKYVTD
ncbi:unnamed protein product [Leptosia nina]|uniref:Uncharacterized protein n=1 Tax=Leptosia nina TaxID=320188 RepID=A0AAV1IXW8_9NEOP